MNTSERGVPRTQAWLLIALGTLAALTAIVLLRATPIHEWLPHWFWRPTTAARPWAWLIVPVIALALAALHALRRTGAAPGRVLVAIILLGFCLQHCFALMEARGINGMRDRLLHTGHSLFSVEAARQPDIWQVATHYEAMVRNQQLAFYPNGTKPPGQLLFYMATERAARWLPGSDAVQRTATLGAWLWPLLSYLAIVPLYLLARPHLPGNLVYLPCLLYLSLPNQLLVTLHLDQCLYPLLFLSPIALFVAGMRQRRRALLMAAGACTAVALFVSYSLVAIAPMVLVLLALSLRPGAHDDRAGSIDWRARLHAAVAAGMYFLAGLLALELLFWLVLDFHVIDNYRATMAAHQAWKIQQWDAATVLYVGLLDTLEYALWSGWPVFGLAALFVAAAVRGWRQASPQQALAIAFLLTFLALAFAGKTVAETARLWLFLAPLLALFASQQLARAGQAGAWRLAAAAIALQLGSAWSIKLWQDFY